ncbi:MAG: DUF393 domain-containing protein [Saprospiraceae bacterium]|nr:DUF393 domain-containing protein [Saprospiraceae bacterium]
MESAKRIVFFDGICNLCNSSVRFIYKRDKRNVFSYRSLQSKEAERLILDTGILENLSSIVLYEEGKVYTHSTAIFRIVSRLAPPYSWLSIFAIVPKPIRDAVYNFVAKNRYKWFGKQKEVCEFDPNFNSN